jgi:uncharacterized protein
MRNSWSEKIVVVTGGSAGLGRVLAEEFLRLGSTVVVLARDRERLETMQQEMEQYTPRLIGIATDVTRQEEVDRAFAEIVRRFERLDVLANVAGKSARGSIEQTTAEEMAQLMDVNLMGSVRCTRAAIPLLRKSKGSLVFVGSLAGKMAAPYLGGYPAAKFALGGYAHQARLELAPEIHVMLVSPGPIQRVDAGSRYNQTGKDIPMASRKPGGGVRLHGLDPRTVARALIRGCERRVPEIVLPRKGRILAGIIQWFPAWGDWIIRRVTRG